MGVRPTDSRSPSESARHAPYHTGGNYHEPRDSRRPAGPGGKGKDGEGGAGGSGRWVILEGCATGAGGILGRREAGGLSSIPASRMLISSFFWCTDEVSRMLLP
ncbi:hypothetical protein OPV22_026094 [Ensete ventricosum]|uniref:Uncharacterized protein n=1 Tax=Ensete ventricosum TaxID=4639 RepID=A0AAV8P851_ENSVE|nr:hypothetical protein OPV22_026094 [Ensete ventricosum]